jgi:hypothetical protein
VCDFSKRNARLEDGRDDDDDLTLKQRANTYSYYNNSFLLSRVFLSSGSAKTRKAAKKGEHSLSVCFYFLLLSLLSANVCGPTRVVFIARVFLIFSSPPSVTNPRPD